MTYSQSQLESAFDLIFKGSGAEHWKEEFGATISFSGTVSKAYLDRKLDLFVSALIHFTGHGEGEIVGQEIKVHTLGYWNIIGA